MKIKFVKKGNKEFIKIRAHVFLKRLSEMIFTPEKRSLAITDDDILPNTINIENIIHCHKNIAYDIKTLFLYKEYFYCLKVLRDKIKKNSMIEISVHKGGVASSFKGIFIRISKDNLSLHINTYSRAYKEFKQFSLKRFVILRTNKNNIHNLYTFTNMLLKYLAYKKKVIFNQIKILRVATISIKIGDKDEKDFFNNL